MAEKENLVAVVQHFIREGTIQMREGRGETSPLIITGDLDQDGNEELTAIYKEAMQYKIVGIKKVKGRWTNAWYKPLPNEKIEDMQKIKDHIVIFTGEGQHKGFQVLQWTEGGIAHLKESNCQYSKLISVHNRKQAFIIGWKKDENGQYAIDLYEINEKDIIKRKEEEEGFLEGLKCCQEQMKEKEILRAQTISVLGEETEVYLLGRKHEDEIEELEVVVGATTQTEEMRWHIREKRVAHYEWAVGYFELPENEQIYLRIEEAEEKNEMKSWLWDITLNGMVDLMEAVRSEPLALEEARWQVMMLQLNGPLCLMRIGKTDAKADTTYCEMYKLKEGKLIKDKYLQVSVID